ncbi:S1 family peptidase [Brevibacterium otitidis]|uniref:S1 family peptidase n=1 Tax=Brevibacterium otitidis TaxID=53364 RepID=A0ABV5X472_9MICO|nr:S1 family peptidase [Brevibacterium otitidis]
MKRTIVHAALVGSLAFAGMGAAALPALAAPSGDAANTAIQKSPEVKKVEAKFSEKELKIMAESSGRTVAAQKDHLEAQFTQNNDYYDLVQAGNTYDGAFFNDENKLVLQAPAGSAEAKAAEAAGFEVRDAAHGENKLNEIADELSKLAADDSDVVSVAPRVAEDAVVVTVTDPNADTAVLDKAAEFGAAVDVQKGERQELHTTALGGDKVTMASGGYCSAGFPATDSSGQHVMVWAGHCVEDQESFTVDGVDFGTHGETAFKSYDGQPDRDIGYVVLNEGNEVSTDVNTYGSDAGITGSAEGAWQAPIGTELCRTGATSGVTCGEVTGYNASVNYSDGQGQDVAQVTGLGESTVCTAAGDSGGAYTAGNQAVGMTSGGPAGQDCGFNGGYVDGSSYFQPVPDALDYYNLEYGHK